MRGLNTSCPAPLTSSKVKDGSHEAMDDELMRNSDRPSTRLQDELQHSPSVPLPLPLLAHVAELQQPPLVPPVHVRG